MGRARYIGHTVVAIVVVRGSLGVGSIQQWYATTVNTCHHTVTACYHCPPSLLTSTSSLLTSCNLTSLPYTATAHRYNIRDTVAPDHGPTGHDDLPLCIPPRHTMAKVVRLWSNSVKKKQSGEVYLADPSTVPATMGELQVSSMNNKTHRLSCNGTMLLCAAGLPLHSGCTSGYSYAQLCQYTYIPCGGTCTVNVPTHDHCTSGVLVSCVVVLCGVSCVKWGIHNPRRYFPYSSSL